jgi:type I restriction enzyme S subunit
MALRRCARLQRGAGFPHEQQGHGEGSLPFFKVGDFASNGNERELRICNNWVSRSVAAELRAVPVPTGSILLPKIGAALLGNARRITTRQSVFDNNVLAVVPCGVDSRYLYYWLSIVDLAELANPGPVPSLNDGALLDLGVPVHRPDEQRAIADFLDTETARIDALIAKKRRMVGLLSDRQQAAIDRALYDAGPQIALRRLITRLTSGPRGWSERAGDVGSPFIRIANVQRRSIALKRDDLLRVEDPETAEADRTRVRPGDVLVSITADIGSVGLAATEEDGAFVSQHVALLTPADGAGEWIAYAIKSTAAQHALAAGQYGGTKTQLALGDLAALLIPFPPNDVREERLRTLAVELDRGMAAMEKLERQLTLLTERRQALITAAVTGELDIPGVAA